MSGWPQSFCFSRIYIFIRLDKILLNSTKNLSWGFGRIANILVEFLVEYQIF